MLNLSDNREISDSKPSVYFKKMEEIFGEKLGDILHSNYIDNEAFKAGLDDNYEKFVDMRSEFLIKGPFGDALDWSDLR